MSLGKSDKWTLGKSETKLLHIVEDLSRMVGREFIRSEIEKRLG